MLRLLLLISVLIPLVLAAEAQVARRSKRISRQLLNNPKHYSTANLLRPHAHRLPNPKMSCDMYTCDVALGGFCSNLTTNHKLCKVNEYCDTKANKCVEFPYAGLTCGTVYDCNPYLLGFFGVFNFDCISGKCVDAFFLDSGEACSHSYECAEGTSCTGGKCSKGGTENSECGESCGSSGCKIYPPCEKEYFCAATNESLLCKAKSKLGESCWFDQLGDSNCPVGSACLNGICAKQLSVKKGGACNETNDCMGDLYCNVLSKRCEPQNFPDVCVNNAQCPKGYNCSCENYKHGAFCENPNGDFPITRTCKPQFEATAACLLAATKCNDNNVNYNPRSCEMKHCGKEMSCYYDCIYNDRDTSCQGISAQSIAGMPPLCGGF